MEIVVVSQSRNNGNPPTRTHIKARHSPTNRKSTSRLLRVRLFDSAAAVAAAMAVLSRAMLHGQGNQFGCRPHVRSTLFSVPRGDADAEMFEMVSSSTSMDSSSVRIDLDLHILRREVDAAMALK